MTQAEKKTARDLRRAAFAGIEDLAEVLADNDAALAAAVTDCEAEIRAVQSRHADTIRLRADAVAAAKRELLTAIDAQRALFDRPKSRVLSGVKLGLRKGQDTLELGDESKLLARIHGLMPEKMAVLVREKVEIVKSAVKALPAADLQKLGIRYVVGADEPFAAMDKSDAEKQAEAILSAAGGAS